MKVTPLTTEQQAELQALKATATTAQQAAHTAHKALQAAMLAIVGTKSPMARVQLSDDGKSIIS